MSKRVIFAENIGDGKFIQVEGPRAGISCPEYPAIENEIARIQAMLPPQGAKAPEKWESAKPFKCPSYAELIHRLARLQFKLWLQQLRTLGKNLGGTTRQGGQSSIFLDWAIYRSNEWYAIRAAMTMDPIAAINIAQGIADRIRPIDPGRPGPDQ